MKERGLDTIEPD